MPDQTLPTYLPATDDYVPIAAPLDMATLQAIIAGMESDADTNPAGDDFPTNCWVRQLYAAVTDSNQSGYVLVYGAPPYDGSTARPVQVVAINGVDEAAKARAASIAVGDGNELIGYEDLAGGQRVVVFRAGLGGTLAGTPGISDHLSWESTRHPERAAWSATLPRAGRCALGEPGNGTTGRFHCRIQRVVGRPPAAFLGRDPGLDVAVRIELESWRVLL